MESNQNNFAAWIASAERSSNFSAHAHSAIMYDRRRFDSVGCFAITMSIFPFMNLIGPFKFSSLANRKGIKMRANKIIWFAVGAMLLVATTARAGETVIVSNVLGPEGPLYIDGN